MTHLCIIIQFILKKGMIASFLTTMWDHMYGFTNQYHCASAIYQLSFLDLDLLRLLTKQLDHLDMENMLSML